VPHFIERLANVSMYLIKIITMFSRLPEKTLLSKYHTEMLKTGKDWRK
jgi:hypothetical protein